MSTLRTRDDIRLLLADKKQLYAWSSIQLSLDFIPDEVAQARLEAQLNAWKNECGCSLGAMTLWGGITVLLLWSFIEGFPFPGNLLVKAGFTLLWVMAFAVVGKLVGISLARRKMRRKLQQLLTE